MPEQHHYNSIHTELLKFGASIAYPPFTPHRLHTHETCELYYLVRGSGHYITEGSRYELKPGRIILMRPGEMHKAELTDEKAYENTVFHFSPSILDSFDPEHRLLAPFFDRPLGLNNVYDRSALAGTDIYSLLQKCRTKRPNDYDNRVHMTGILISILEQLKTLFDEKQYTVSSKSEDTIHSVITYVNQNLTHHLNPDRICQEFNISRAQLDRNFKNATGSTVWAYITAKRLLLAKSSKQEGMRATDVSSACGFQDYSTFYRAYAKHFGLTPSGSPATQVQGVIALNRE